MNQTDIKYILEQLDDAINEKDWEIIEDARNSLKEFLDEEIYQDEDLE